MQNEEFEEQQQQQLAEQAEMDAIMTDQLSKIKAAVLELKAKNRKKPAGPAAQRTPGHIRQGQGLARQDEGEGRPHLSTGTDQ